MTGAENRGGLDIRVDPRLQSCTSDNSRGAPGEHQPEREDNDGRARERIPEPVAVDRVRSDLRPTPEPEEAAAAARIQNSNERENEENGWKAEPNVYKSLAEEIESAAEVTGADANQKREDRDEDDGPDADHGSDLAAINDTAVDVAAVVVRAEPVVTARPDQRIREVD
jgi:hypothetical protein